MCGAAVWSRQRREVTIAQQIGAAITGVPDHRARRIDDQTRGQGAIRLVLL
jgi:hypothetical protein